MQNTSQEVGQRLRFLRRAADLTQYQLGKQIGRPASFISSIERGQLTPPRAALLKLATALFVEPAALKVNSKESSSSAGSR